MSARIAPTWGRLTANPVDLGYGGVITRATVATWPERVQRSYAHAGMLSSAMLWPDGIALASGYVGLSQSGLPASRVDYEQDSLYLRATRPHDGLRAITVSAYGIDLDVRIVVSPIGASNIVTVLTAPGTVAAWASADVTIPDLPCIVTLSARRVSETSAIIYAVGVRERVLEEADL